MSLFLLAFAGPAAAQMWEILPFGDVPKTDAVTREAIERLETVANLLDNERVDERAGVMSTSGWPETEEGWEAWVERRRDRLGAALVSPWGTPVEYVFTDGHHSYALNFYDTAGALVVAYLGGASHRVGPIPYRAPALMRTPVGESIENLHWNRSQWTSPVGRLVADAMREGAGADVALHNFLGTRASIPQGVVTREHLRYVLPFGNRLAVVRMPGADLVAELDRSADAAMPWFVSGLRREGRGRYVTDAGEAVEADRTYAVAVSDYVARGGRYGDYGKFSDLPRVPAPESDLVDVLADYIRAHSPIRADPAPRWGDLEH